MRPPRSGWTLVFFALVAAYVVAIATDVLRGAYIAIATAVLIVAYFGYRKLAER